MNPVKWSTKSDSTSGEVVKVGYSSAIMNFQNAVTHSEDPYGKYGNSFTTC